MGDKTIPAHRSDKRPAFRGPGNRTPSGARADLQMQHAAVLRSLHAAIAASEQKPRTTARPEDRR